MRVRVDLLPRAPYPDVVILVDVLRASTSVTMLLAKGATEVLITPSLRAARACAKDALLFGEREGIPPEGFHHGTSPAEIADLSLSGQRLIYTSENLPQALDAVREARAVFLGGFRNARAVTEAALALAREEIAIVAVGHHRREALDDAIAAGFLAKRIVMRRPEAALVDAAQMAMALLKAFPDPQEALWQSAAGQFLSGLGYVDDLALASLISHDRAVPVLRGIEYCADRPFYRFIRYEA